MQRTCESRLRSRPGRASRRWVAGRKNQAEPPLAIFASSITESPFIFCMTRAR